MNKNEQPRAERLAYDLDQRLQNRQPDLQNQHPDTGQTLPEDRPLLELADRLAADAPFAPTPTERAQLQQKFEQLKTKRKRPNPVFRFLKPTLHTALWAALLIAVFAVVAALIPNLLGKPTKPAAGPTPTATTTSAAPTAPVSTPTKAAVPAPFVEQSQTVDGIRMDLHSVETLGDSLRATLCFQAPSDAPWRLEGVELKTGDRVWPFYPSSSAQPTPGADGFTCETFVTAQRGLAPTGPWTVSARRLISPLSAEPDCARINQQVGIEIPGLGIECDANSHGFGFSADKVPDGVDPRAAMRLVETFYQYDVRSGPWIFAFDPGSIHMMIAAGGPISPVVVPAACDPDVSGLNTGEFGLAMGRLAYLSGTTGAGSAQSGDFTFRIGLACDPSFSRLVSGGDNRSEINGLGIMWTVTYHGQPIDGELQSFSGIEPFVDPSGSTSGITDNSSMDHYGGMQFPENVRPDFTQTDARLRYVVKVRVPGGAVQGAALSFTLQRLLEGFRPADVRVEALRADELRLIQSDPNAPLPFPTLAATTSPVSAETQALLDLLDRWQKPLLSSPGWVHMRTRTEMPNGNDLYGGLKEYTSDDWFQIDAQGLAVAQIHIDRRMDGMVLQQSISQNGKSTNLTFGNTMDFQPFPLDLAYAVKDTLKAGSQVKRVETTISGKPAIALTITGIYNRRDFVDPASGAWLYTEMVKLQPGDNPITGGSLDTRITLEAAERVDAPPAEALALLGQEFSGYTPPTPSGTPAPQGFDPSRSKLSLHAIPGDDFNAPTFWYGDISAEGYLLGRVDFGQVPGGGSCSRSADGSRIAFIYIKSDKNGLVNYSSLRWFDVRDLATVHQPAPELATLGAITWSPAQEALAVFGCRAGEKDCGLYRFDPKTGTLRMLLPGAFADWDPIWSPDGSQIAFIQGDGNSRTVNVVDIQTGNVIYQGKFDADQWQVPADSPTNAWGVTFPRDGSGNNCFEGK